MAFSCAFRIAVLISGGGTTLRNLIERIDAGRLPVEIALVVSSSPTARGLQFARDADIPEVVVERKSFADQDAFSRAIFDRCRRAEVDLVVLGGFFKRITIPDDFAGRVVNIHPGWCRRFAARVFMAIASTKPCWSTARSSAAARSISPTINTIMGR